ncbi:MAG: YihY/virulence factor BrkB family protein [Verrucomicrobiota bacterium]
MPSDPPSPRPSPWRRTLSFLKKTYQSFSRTSGSLHAAAFTYYAFFSLFALVALSVSIASLWINQEEAAEWIIRAIRPVLPLDEHDSEHLVEILNTFFKGRGPASFIAVLVLIWSSARIFKALIHSLNLAWGCRSRRWWVIPLQYAALLAILASGLFLGIAVPLLLRTLSKFIAPTLSINPSAYKWIVFGISTLVLFYCLLMFYKLAPRLKVQWNTILLPSLATAVSLALFQKIFIWITQTIIAPFNPLYGAIGFFMALLYGTYIAGVIIILGGCACAVNGGVTLPPKSDPSP